MPLHSHEKRVIERRFHRLDDAVVAAPDDSQIGCNHAQGLMVPRIRLDLARLCDFGQPSGFEPNAMTIRIGKRISVIFVRRARFARKIFDQRSAEGNIGHLHSATDKERRDFLITRHADDREFEFIAFRDQVALGAFRITAVSPRLDIDAARNDDPIARCTQRRRFVPAIRKDLGFGTARCEGGAIKTCLVCIGRREPDAYQRFAGHTRLKRLKQ